MSAYLGYIWIFILVCGPVPLAIGLIFLVRWLEKRFPNLKKRITLSLWTGVLGLAPGLANSDITNFGGGFINLGRNPDQGWPFFWGGAEGLGLFIVPAAILGDVLVVAGVAFVGFSLFSRIGPTLNSKLERMLYFFLMIGFALLPVWVNLPAILQNMYIMGTPTHTTQEMTDDQYHHWVQRAAKPVMNSIQLEECTNFQLVPSQEHPGSKNIQFTVNAKFIKPDRFPISIYSIGADIVDDSGNPIAQNDPIFQNWGEAPEFLLYAQGHNGSKSIDRPGPYKIVVSVGSLIVTDLDWGTTMNFDNDAMKYGRSIGISDEKLKLECQSPPYTLEDLGLSSVPTPTP